MKTHAQLFALIALALASSGASAQFVKGNEATRALPGGGSQVETAPLPTTGPIRSTKPCAAIAGCHAGPWHMVETPEGLRECTEVYARAGTCRPSSYGTTIHTRHRRQWSRAIPRPGQPQPLMLMVAEVKEIAPSRYGHTAILKHIPDQAFTLDETLYRRLGRCFERELTLWGTEADLHLIVMATFRLDEAGAPAIVEMTLMLATAQWLPVEDAWERQLINALVRNGRSFIKGLRYNSRPVQALASVSLLDCGIAAHPLFIDRDHRHGDPQGHQAPAPERVAADGACTHFGAATHEAGHDPRVCHFAARLDQDRAAQDAGAATRGTAPVFDPREPLRLGSALPADQA